MACGKGLWKSLWRMWKTYGFQQLFCCFVWETAGCITRCINMAEAGNPLRYVADAPWEKSKKNRQKSSLSGKVTYRALAFFPERAKIFVEKHQKRSGMILPLGEILRLTEITGG